MRKLIALTLLVTVGVSLSAQRRRMGDPLPITIAMLRRDGILVPFANYDGKRWANDWPQPSPEPEVPVSLEGVSRKWLRGADPAGPWTMWTTDGKSAPLQVAAPALFEAQCLSNIGLQTTYRSAERVPPPHVQPHPKDAIAVLGDTAVGPIEVAERGSPSHQGLSESKELREWFHLAEQKALDRTGRNWRHPVSANERDKQPVTLDALYSVRYMGGGRISYFEASRKYKWPGDVDAGCDLVTQVQGWIVTQPSGAMQPHTIAGNVFDCEMRGAAFMLPLGHLLSGGKLTWLVQWSGWGFERYAVIEIDRERVRTVLSTPGGGC